MALLSRLLTGVSGSWLTMPALLLMLIVSAYQWKEANARALKAEGKSQCDLSWQLSLQKQRTEAAQTVARQMQEFFELERQTTEGLRHELSDIRTKFAEAKASASSDPRCLSDGVLDLLQRGAAVGGTR